MADKLPETLTFGNPRTQAEFDDWPSGKFRVKCKFYVEHDVKRGFRVCRQTQDKAGKWCEPKTLAFSGHCAIADGSDGKTYVLQIAAQYGFVSIWRHDFMTAWDSVFAEDARHAELLTIINQGQDASTLLYPNR
jgi:hypothetical protein